MEGLKVEAVCHQGNNVRLGDGLTVADGMGAVGVDIVARAGWEKVVPGHGPQRGKKPGIRNPSLDDLNAQHLLLGGAGVVGRGGVHGPTV